MSEFEDDFLLRPGRVGGQGEGRAAGGFLGQVRRATQRACDPGAGRRRGGAGRAKAGRGRGLGAASRDGAGRRRVVVKARIVRHAGARYRAAPLARHIRYLEREGVTRDGAPARMFDAGSEQADVAAFAERCDDDRHHFRFIVSPEDAGEMADLRAFTRELMGRAERDLGTRLDWVAVDHWNTDNPHVHVLVRGRADDGRDLVIAGPYIYQGLRDRAQDLVTLELGPRSAREIEAALDAEVGADRWTDLDRDLRRRAGLGDGVVDLRPGGDAGGPAPRRLLGRAAHLEALGLAQPIGPGRWRLDRDLEVRLKDLSIRGDIIKTLHRAMAREGRAMDPARAVLHEEASTAPVIGRLVERGLRDELSGAAYAIVDGLDGRQHHLSFADLEETSDARPGSVVELLALQGRDGRVSRSLAVRSDLSIEGQVNARGATWLDHQLVRRRWRGLGQGAGFGGEAAAAAERRVAVLVERGLAHRKGGRVTFAPAMLAKLRDQELEAAGARLAAETGKPVRAADPAAPVGGVYRRRLDLASGRFAMIDDGLGFQLVPWRPSLEPHLGRAVMGRAVPGGGLDWTPGRGRGPGL
ncbi:DUF3363 domain-containing protein [Caulobacter sp. UNC358MFTsu5.1]|uniref:relaxase/mobilization nuclease domain-containing protein n=1 Tax=Caulobacter sp. UNC358MFTsu5.1 TaxID=1449049 RepID=UPI0004A6CE30|nr:DUF3363 domain-containing protein [Caulobacter sp. UNC358MFTsu5.1]